MGRAGLIVAYRTRQWCDDDLRQVCLPVDFHGARCTWVVVFPSSAHLPPHVSAEYERPILSCSKLISFESIEIIARLARCVMYRVSTPE